MNFQETLKYAKAQLPKDPRLAAYMVRDFPELVEMELDDLAWAMHCANHVSHTDAEFLFELIDKWMNEHPEKDPR